MATAFAVYSADDNSLNFYKRDTVPSSGDMFNGKAATAVYTGIETDVYMNYPSYQPWSSYKTAITSVSFVDEGIAPVSTANWFRDMNNASLMSIGGLDKLDTSKVTNMNGMFLNCTKLTSLDVRSFNTNNVTNMASMFFGCSALTSLDLSSFNTSNVTGMNEMFSYCSKLTSLDVSHFNTSNVTMMTSMFNGCKALTSLDVSSFNTSSVTKMNSMFYGCSSLTSLDVSSFDTANVTYMNSMFYGCSSLTSLDVSSFDTANVTYMKNMFYDCSSLTNIYVSDKWSVAKVTSSDSMFFNCINLPNFDGSVVDKTNAHGDDGGFLTKFGNVYYTWSGTGTNASDYTCEAYRFVKSNDTIVKQSTAGAITRNTYTSDSVTLTAAFSENWAATTTKTITKAGVAVYSETDNSLNFYKCIGAPVVGSIFEGKTVTMVYTGIENTGTTQPWSSYKTAITSVSFVDKGIAPVSTAYWFDGMNSVISIDLSKLNTSNVTNMNSMFSNCTKLTNLDVSGFNTSSVTIMNYMFKYCSGLTSLDVRSFNTSSVTNMYEMFYGCSKLTSLDLSSFNTSSVTMMASMFNRCSSLTILDLSSFDTSIVTNMNNMFYGCSLLTNIYVSDTWSVAKVTSSDSMFFNCTKLPNFNSSMVDKTNAHAGEGGYLRYISPADKVKVILEKGAVDIIVNTIKEIESSIPAYTSADEGKFLRVVNGAPAWVGIQNAEGASF